MQVFSNQTLPIAAKIFKGKERALNSEILSTLAVHPYLKPSQIANDIETEKGVKHKDSDIQSRLAAQLLPMDYVKITGQDPGVKIKTLMVNRYSLTHKGCLAALALQARIDFSHYWAEDFFLDFANFLVRKGGIDQGLVNDWIIKGINEKLQSSTFDLDLSDMEHDPNTFNELALALARRFKLISKGPSSPLLVKFLSTEEARQYIARLSKPFESASVYKTEGRDHNCLHCGRKILQGPASRPTTPSKILAKQFCDRACYNAHFASLFSVGRIENCEQCGKPIYVGPWRIRAVTSGMFFCDLKCQHEFQKTSKVRNCEECGNEFRARGSRLATSRWCSKKCWQEWMRKHPEASSLTKLSKEDRSKYGKKRTPARIRQLKDIQEVSHKLIKRARRGERGKLLKNWNATAGGPV